MLKGPRITLRAVTRDDLPRYVTWLNDIDVTRHLMALGPMNLDDETAWYEGQRNNNNVINFAIDIETGEHIGSISLMDIDRQEQKAEIGIVIGDKMAWGKGYCQEAMGLIIDYAFNTINLNRVHLRVDVDNIGGIKCYERSGFVKEGELREVVFREGKFHNQYILSILRREYSPPA